MSHYLRKNVLPSRATRIFLFKKKQYLVKYLVVLLQRYKLFKNNNVLDFYFRKINPFFVCKNVSIRGETENYFPRLGAVDSSKYQNVISSDSPSGKNGNARFITRYS